MKTLIMKLAVLAFLSLDARAGVIPQPEMRPYDEVMNDFKSRVAANELPSDIVEAGMNQMEIWTQSGGKVKSHRFDLSTVNRGEPIHPTLAFVQSEEGDVSEELKIASATLEQLTSDGNAMKERIAELETLLAEKTSGIDPESTPLIKGAGNPPSPASGVDLNISESETSSEKSADSTDIQPASVPGLSSSEPGVETPPASETSTDGNPSDTSETSSASPKGAGKKSGAKAT